MNEKKKKKTRCSDKKQTKENIKKEKTKQEKGKNEMQMATHTVVSKN